MSESHRTLRDQLGAYALGQLAGEEWQKVHAHVESCARCRDDLEEIAPVAGMLHAARDDIRDVEGPEELLAAPPLSPDVLRIIREANADDAPRPAPAPAPRRRRLALVAVAAAVAMAVGGAGYVVGVTSAPGPAPVAGEAVAIRSSDGRIQAAAVLVPHTWGTEVYLTATGFTAGETYQVSVADNAGRLVSAGAFVGTGAAQMRCHLNSSVLRADASAFRIADPSGRVVLGSVF